MTRRKKKKKKKNMWGRNPPGAKVLLWKRGPAHLGSKRNPPTWGPVLQKQALKGYQLSNKQTHTHKHKHKHKHKHIQKTLYKELTSSAAEIVKHILGWN